MKLKLFSILFLMILSVINVNSAVVNNQTNSFTTSDSVAIYYDVYYDNAINNAPTLVISPAFSSALTRIGQRNTANYFAGLGYFVINVDSRGKGSSGGSDDMNGLECLELTEVFTDVENKYGTYSGDLKYIGGGSGGGGTAMTCLVKYPDFFNAGFSWFGISNYTAWWNEEPDYRTIIEGFMDSATPSTNSEGYESRGALTGVYNIYSPLILMHNSADTIVSSSHSSNINTSLNTLGRDVVYYENDIIHGEEISDKTHIDNTASFLNSKTSNINTPSKDELNILGYLDTKRLFVEFDDVDSIGKVNYNFIVEDEKLLSFTSRSNTNHLNIDIKNVEPSTKYYITRDRDGVTVDWTSGADGILYFSLYNWDGESYSISTQNLSKLTKYEDSSDGVTANVWSRHDLTNKIEVVA